jgi:1,4-dihydroxy-2-naphthoate polyprenyltransferase
MWQYVKTWYWAIRPFSLSASVVPIVLGSVLALRYEAFDGFLFALMLLGSMLVQSGTNLIDEYADHEQGQTPGKVLAPYKVIALGQLTPRAVRLGALICFGAAALIGLYLVGRTGWPLALVCLASVGVAYGYSAGPYPLGQLGLGEPLVFVFMGPVMVLSSFYVHAHTLYWPVVWLSLPIGCLVTAILVVNNLRDVDEDLQHGKSSMATVWGRRTASWVYCGLLLVAFGTLGLLVISGTGSWLWLVPFILLPQSIAVAQQVRQGRERVVLHQALQGTAALHLRFGLLLAVALSPFLSQLG